MAAARPAASLAALTLLALALTGFRLLDAAPAGADAGAEATLLARLAAARAAAGVPMLAVDEGLGAVARQWSARMAVDATIAHNPSLTSEAPRGWTRIAENVGAADAVDHVVDAWLESAAHRRNVVDRAFNRVGVGIAVKGDTMYVTADLTAVPTGTAASSPAATAPAGPAPMAAAAQPAPTSPPAATTQGAAGTQPAPTAPTPPPAPTRPEPRPAPAPAPPAPAPAAPAAPAPVPVATPAVLLRPPAPALGRGPRPPSTPRPPTAASRPAVDPPASPPPRRSMSGMLEQLRALDPSPPSSPAALSPRGEGARLPGGRGRANVTYLALALAREGNRDVDDVLRRVWPTPTWLRPSPVAGAVAG